MDAVESAIKQMRSPDAAAREETVAEGINRVRQSGSLWLPRPLINLQGGGGEQARGSANGGTDEGQKEGGLTGPHSEDVDSISARPPGYQVAAAREEFKKKRRLRSPGPGLGRLQRHVTSDRLGRRHALLFCRGYGYSYVVRYGTSVRHSTVRKSEYYQ